MSLNITIMTGRMVADPELRETKSNIPVTSFRIAVRRDYAKKDDQDATDFFDVIAWRSSAEFVCKYFSKGSTVTVTGRMENRKWEDKHGQPRVTTELIADKVYFGDSKDKSEGAGGFDMHGSGPAGAAPCPPDDFDPFQ